MQNVNLDDAAINLAVEAFNQIGAHTIPASAEAMALSVQLALEKYNEVTSAGLCDNTKDYYVDSFAAEYVFDVVNCCNKADVLNFFDEFDEYLTDEAGKYHAEWLLLVAKIGCMGLAVNLFHMPLPEALSNALDTYLKQVA